MVEGGDRRSPPPNGEGSGRRSRSKGGGGSGGSHGGRERRKSRDGSGSTRPGTAGEAGAAGTAGEPGVATEALQNPGGGVLEVARAAGCPADGATGGARLSGRGSGGAGRESEEAAGLGGGSILALASTSGGGPIGGGGGGSLAGKVYVKSPARRSDGSRNPGGAALTQATAGQAGSCRSGAATPGTVRSLMERFGSDAGGDLVRSSWAATMAKLEKQQADAGDEPRKPPAELSGESGFLHPLPGGGDSLDGKVDSSGLKDMNWTAGQLGVNDFDTNMFEEGSSATCPQGARDNAAKDHRGNIGPTPSDPPLWDRDLTGRMTSETCDKSRCDTGMAEADAAIWNGQQSSDCSQHARRFAPTMSDVEFSLGRAGLSAGTTLYKGNGPTENLHSELPFGNPEDPTQTNDGRPTPLRGNGPQAAWRKMEPIRVTHVPPRNEVSVDGVAVDLNPTAVTRNVARLEKALVGNLLGRKLPFGFLSGELSRRWAQFGKFQLIMTGADNFICVFEHGEARDAVLMGGPWFVAGQVIGMDKWAPGLSPNSLKGLSAPIWIRLPQLPLMYWDNDSIVRIASMIGQPLWVDAQTSSWGRSNYARICVRIDLSQKLSPGVMINGLTGRFFQAVEYEGLSHVCFNCGLVGHKAPFCKQERSAPGCSEVDRDNNKEGSSLDRNKTDGKEQPRNMEEPTSRTTQEHMARGTTDTVAATQANAHKGKSFCEDFNDLGFVVSYRRKPL